MVWQTSTLITLDVINKCGECHAKYFIVRVRLSHTYSQVCGFGKYSCEVTTSMKFKALTYSSVSELMDKQNNTV